MSAPLDLTAIGQRIAELTAELQRHQNDDTEDTAEGSSCVESLNDALEELRTCMVPPSRWWQSTIMNPADAAAIQVVFKARIFDHMPLNTSISIKELATLSKLPEDNLGRILRLLVLNRILAEPEIGHFAHTPLSLAAKTTEISKGSGFLFSMFSKAAASLADAVISHQEGYTAWEAAFGSPVYQFFENHPTEREQFGAALATLATSDLEDLSAIFPWESLNKLVDVGGGAGHVAVTLARKYSELRVVNQDLPGVIDDCKKALAGVSLDDVYSRIEFESHDFYAPQPVKDADAYLIRQCLHNNCDADCVKILRALVPGLLTQGARLLINETVLENQPTSSLQKAKRLRRKDLMAMTIGAKERTQSEFLSLLKAADERYEIEHIYHGRGDLALLSVKLVDAAP